ncbi:hypothetical protein DFR58_111110 [Anaerobacterium chartisolvens]|uniref:Uncharacterized protein n=1 Tax=Anaerobacterium chartisolvens TaxID=1297424 RepID=A0A369B4W1_9FIRM|nr:hypothetical protein DFR58_111110 [Anaerobacterium chartisolvens]
MIRDLFHVTPHFFKNGVYRGLIYFLMLIVLAMMLINPIVVLLPVIFIVSMSCKAYIPECQTGYISVALTVCKNE